MQRDQMELQLTALVESMHPQLVRKVLVKYEPRGAFLMWIQYRGERTKLTLTDATMQHPETYAVIHRAAMHVLEMRRSTTSATAIGGPDDEPHGGYKN